MAKGSGNTRAQSPNNGQQQAGERFLQPAMMDAIADTIAKGGYLTFMGEQHDAWQDMTTDERDLTLMLAGFTGMIDSDHYDEFGTLYIPLPKKDLLNEIEEALDNEWTGNGMDDSTMFTIGYKDGSRKYIAPGETDFEPKQKITSNTSPREVWRRARASLGLRDVAYIIRTDGYQEPNYWVADNEQARELLRKYGGFEYWRNGRGEKRRQYIQDDWI